MLFSERLNSTVLPCLCVSVDRRRLAPARCILLDELLTHTDDLAMIVENECLRGKITVLLGTLPFLCDGRMNVVG